MQSHSIAKTIIFSSVCTAVILGSIGFIFRTEFVVWLESELATTAQLPVSVQSSGLADEVSQYETAVTSAIAKANPAVVSVVVTKDVPVFERYYESYEPDGWFGGFLIPRTRQSGTEEREVGGGSGFIVSVDGMIVTNRHVVDDEDADYSVLLNDGTAYDATVLARDPQLDIAILQLTEPPQAPLPLLRFADATTLQLGQTAIAIGNALAEFRNSVSVGVVSGVARSIIASDSMGRTEQLHEVIQTDAAINPGNSGGPLLNIAGDVIGVNVATSRGADNIGFALPANLVESVVDSVREYGEIVRPYLGVRYAVITEQIAEMNNLPVSYGVLVVTGESADEPAVIPGSPADQAGLTAGTIILAVDGTKLQNVDLSTVLRTKSVGDVVELTILEQGERRVISVTLAKAL